MSCNRWDLDGPGRLSLARYLVRRGYDIWIVELRGAGRSLRPNRWNGKRYEWTFEDYVQPVAPVGVRAFEKPYHPEACNTGQAPAAPRLLGIKE